jgi:hypothetical protein
VKQFCLVVSRETKASEKAAGKNRKARKLHSITVLKFFSSSLQYPHYALPLIEHLLAASVGIALQEDAPL